MKSRALLATSILCLGTAIAAPGQAGVIASHLGGADPELNGWQKLDGTHGVGSGASNAFGELGWLVNDVSSAGGSFLTFRDAMTAEEQAEVNATDWTFSSRLGVLDRFNDVIGSSTHLSVSTGNRIFTVDFANAVG